jgi:hypothetical protein
MNISSPCVVLWDLPSSELAGGATVLSFLSPRLEHELIARGAAKDVVTMARGMDAVSAEALVLYLDIVADIGLYTLPNGKTLREALRGKDKASLWWYHPVTFRDSESDPTFTNILSILAIARAVGAVGTTELRLVRPPAGVAEVLRSRYRVVVERPARRSEWINFGRSLLGRLRFLVRAVETMMALDRYYKHPNRKLDVALQGFWDWSVFPDDDSPNLLRDRYFGRLPDELRQRGKHVGYWCWYDPWNRPGKINFRHREIVVPLQSRGDVILLQSHLTIPEIVGTVLDARVLLTFLSVVWKRSFTELFARDGIDYYPLFKLPLLAGGVASGIPYCVLVERATARAAVMGKPKSMITFLEHFPHSRAMYAALGGNSTRSWSVQHASYSRGKTFLSLHPEKEFAIQRDGQAVPCPDRVCVMGELGYRLFRGCGYAQHQVLLTGSTRYEHIQIPKGDRTRQSSDPENQRAVNVLIATSLPASADFLLVDAAVEAVKGLADRIRLRLRQHPFDNMQRIAGFTKIESHLETRENTLNQDLDWADLVLISQSMVGEEAFLARKAVWQFRFPHPNQSALSEVAAIPRFYTVAELRQALLDLTTSATPLPPEESDTEQVYRALFQVGGKRPSVAIADAICAEFQ